MKESVRKEIENIIEKKQLNCTVENFSKCCDMANLSYHKVLSEDFIREFKDKVNWSFISQKQKLTESFIEEHDNYVHWEQISKFQKLSEDFIKNCFQYDIAYNLIKYQKLSNSFIIDKIDNENIYFIKRYQKLSPDTIKKYDLQISEHNWLYKDYTFKYDKVKECGLYEIDGEYVIAYKGILKDNYSKYNFQYQYLPGLTYECHADHNNGEENSFGLSAWTKDNALNYCKQKLIKVKIHINDIAALVHDSNKIRCTKFTVINSVD